jgi:hypothetical protein
MVVGPDTEGADFTAAAETGSGAGESFEVTSAGALKTDGPACSNTEDTGFDAGAAIVGAGALCVPGNPLRGRATARGVDSAGSGCSVRKVACSAAGVSFVSTRKLAGQKMSR